MYWGLLQKSPALLVVSSIDKVFVKNYWEDEGIY